MRSKIISVAVIATTLATWAFVYADSQTSSWITNKIGKWFFQKFDWGRWMNWAWSMWFWIKGFGRWWIWWPWQELTAEEKTKLETMTQEEKKSFFETKMIAEKTKREAKEKVIDKLINWETLNDADKVTLAEIKTEREKQKTLRAEMDAKIAEAKPLLDKLKSWQTLTEDEKTKLSELKINWKFWGPGMQKWWKHRR